VRAHVREHAEQRVLCAFNLSDSAATLKLPDDMAPAAILAESGATGAELDGNVVRFQPWGVVFARLA